ncbi:MAG: outer membrane beta-barrel protein [Ferruginibacter sp.]
MRILMVCAAIVFNASSYAQKNIQIGLRYMPTLTALWNKDDKSTGAELHKESTKSLGTGGIAFDYGFTKTIGLEVDVLYARNGQEYTGVNLQSGSTAAYNRVVAIQAMANNTPVTGSYQAKAELNSIKIPILLKLSTPNTNKMYYTLSVGPQIDYINDVVYELNGEDITLTSTGIDNKDAYKKTTLDGVIGFGLARNASSHIVLSAQTRFDYGFGDVEEKNITYGSPAISYYPSGRAATHSATASLVFGVSYKF